MVLGFVVLGRAMELDLGGGVVLEVGGVDHDAADDAGEGEPDCHVVVAVVANRTPWDSPRELPEDELAAYIAGQAEAAGTTDRVIFNFHVPPHDTPIDQAALLDAEARIGRTLAINPGSEYSEGVLRGAIITLNRKKGVRGYQLVAG
jgi:Icc-related predicted phosphoesterase